MKPVCSFGQGSSGQCHSSFLPGEADATEFVVALTHLGIRTSDSLVPIPGFHEVHARERLLLVADILGFDRAEVLGGVRRADRSIDISMMDPESAALRQLLKKEGRECFTAIIFRRHAPGGASFHSYDGKGSGTLRRNVGAFQRRQGTFRALSCPYGGYGTPSKRPFHGSYMGGGPNHLLLGMILLVMAG